MRPGLTIICQVLDNGRANAYLVFVPRYIIVSDSANTNCLYKVNVCKDVVADANGAAHGLSALQ